MFTFNQVRGCLKNEEWGGYLIFNNGFSLADLTLFDSDGNIIPWENAVLLSGASTNPDRYGIENLADNNPGRIYFKIIFIPLINSSKSLIGFCSDSHQRFFTVIRLEAKLYHLQP